MIRQMEDEKKKRNRQHRDDFSGGMTDEALMALIEQVETEELLHAPGQLKENIFTQIRQERRAAKKRQLFTYRAKVLIAVAAALTVLIFTPDDGAERVQKTPVRRQEQTEELEEIAQKRQQSRDSEWERYLAERESGGMRGFWDNINEKMAQFGTELYQNINKE